MPIRSEIFVRNIPLRRNMVKKTTESKYVVVAPRVRFAPIGRLADMARRATDEKYAMDTPRETYYGHPTFLCHKMDRKPAETY